MNARLALLYNKLSLLGYISLCIILFIGIFIGSPANAAFECSRAQADGSRSPVAHTRCGFGNCGICESSTGWDGWLYPRAEVLYQPGSDLQGIAGAFNANIPTYRRTIDTGKCDWMAGVRFCVRTAKSGQVDSEKNAADYISNNTGRPQICAYEDPCDAKDPHTKTCANNSDDGKYHYQTKIPKKHEEDAQEWYNHVVTTPVGCIDRKIGPIPPMWSNNAWFSNSLPLPTFEELPNSVFESPKIKAKICRPEANSTSIVECGGKSVVDEAASIILNPLPTGSELTNYIDCKNTLDGSNNGSGRKWCAKVTAEQPNRVSIIYVTTDNSGGTPVTEENEVFAFDRPGYMPKPLVTEAADSSFTAPKITIGLRGKTLTLDDDAGLRANPPTVTPGKVTSGVLHQVQFALEKPCVPGQLVNNPDGTVTCNLYQSVMCAIGYDKAPFTVANKVNDAPLQTLPNIKKDKNINFINANAHTEPATSGTALSESYKKDVWVYDDVSAVDDAVNKLRPLNSFEADQCVFTPPDDSVVTYTNPGAYNYTVPINCSEVTVQVWGGGGAGVWADNHYGNDSPIKDSSGGAGAYIAGTFAVDSTLSPAQRIAVVVGSGGTAKGADGANSKVSIGAITYATAKGGTSGKADNVVGAGGTSIYDNLFTRTFAQDGGNGISSNGNCSPSKDCSSVQAGGAAYGSTGQAASYCNSRNGNGVTPTPFGGGGCSQADSTSYNCISRDAFGNCTGHRTESNNNGSWGKGGHGKVTIQCTKGLN